MNLCLLLLSSNSFHWDYAFLRFQPAAFFKVVFQLHLTDTKACICFLLPTLEFISWGGGIAIAFPLESTHNIRSIVSQDDPVTAELQPFSKKRRPRGIEKGEDTTEYQELHEMGRGKYPSFRPKQKGGLETGRTGKSCLYSCYTVSHQGLHTETFKRSQEHWHPKTFLFFS